MGPRGDSGDDFGTKKNQHHIMIITGLALGSIWRSFCPPKSVIQSIDLVLFLMSCFLLLLKGFGVDLGAILVSKMCPKCERPIYEKSLFYLSKSYVFEV